MERGRGRSGGMLPLLALHALTEYYRLPWKPPVTAGLVAANTLIYLRPGSLHSLLPSIDQVWFNPHLILENGDLKRFFLSPFYHVSESHLVYNMMSLLWKGVQLETSMGSTEFISMVAALLGLSQGITLLLTKSLLLFDIKRPYYREYAAGFSGILFAMKVVLNSQAENYTSVHGLVVPARYAAWAELVLIQMFVPGVSFLGHLGGILAGILYLRLKASYSGSDPLTMVVRRLAGMFTWPVRYLSSLFRFPRRRITGRGTVGRDQTGRTLAGIWRCDACTYDNSGWLSICEMCGTDRDGNEGLLSTHQYLRRSNNSRDLDLEELRQRRIERFG